MFRLNRDANDTSLALDLLRALAAQMVCIGHAWNLVDVPHDNTKLPDLGVLLFFILSGFVIAHTLNNKSKRDDYSLVRYGVERLSRIYCAYLPAILLFAVVEMSLRRLGIEPSNNGPVTISNFFGNLLMMQD